MSGTSEGSDARQRGNDAVSRRGLLRAAAAAAAVGGAAGASGVTAAQGDDRPDFGGWLDGVDGGFEDARGQDEVTVQVGAEGNQGNFAYSPAGLWVDPGTTVQWEWTGEGTHDVVAQEGAEFSSGELLQEAGVHFEHTFEEGGVVTYQCTPHVSLGMKGAVAVGDDVPMGGGSGDESGMDSGGSGDGSGDAGSGDAGSVDGTPQITGGVPSRFSPVGIAALGAMGLAIVGTLYLTLLGVRDDRHSEALVADEE